jgi:hypothetical protein
MNETEMNGFVERVFGVGVPFAKVGNFVHVHLDVVNTDIRVGRELSFVAENFFDCNCVHCKPFLADGAIIVHRGAEMEAMRLLGGGMFEMVVLTRPNAIN